MQKALLIHPIELLYSQATQRCAEPVNDFETLTIAIY